MYLILVYVPGKDEKYIDSSQEHCTRYVGLSVVRCAVVKNRMNKSSEEIKKQESLTEDNDNRLERPQVKCYEILPP